MDFIADNERAAETPRQPYSHQPYPSVRYHRLGETILVNDEDESDALKKDPDWSDTPATFCGHSAPSVAQREEEKRRNREEQRQAALAAARAKAAADQPPAPPTKGK